MNIHMNIYKTEAVLETTIEELKRSNISEIKELDAVELQSLCPFVVNEFLRICNDTRSIKSFEIKGDKNALLGAFGDNLDLLESQTFYEIAIDFNWEAIYLLLRDMGYSKNECQQICENHDSTTALKLLELEEPFE